MILRGAIGGGAGISTFAEANIRLFGKLVRAYRENLIEFEVPLGFDEIADQVQLERHKAKIRRCDRIIGKEDHDNVLA